MKKNIWLIGCSSGIGLELLKLFLKDSSHVIASSRTASSNKELLKLQNEYPTTLKLLDVDVSNYENIKETSKIVFEHFTALDLCFFNAGVYEAMNCEQWQVKEFEKMTNINYLGAVRLADNLLPYFEKQDSGHLVFNASLSSYYGLPYGGAYSASKAALVNFAQSIQPEFLAKNIKVQIINHGFVKTRLTAKNDFEMPELMQPFEAAKNIFKALKQSYQFEIRFPFKLSLFLRLMNLLPYGLSTAINKRLLK